MKAQTEAERLRLKLSRKMLRTVSAYSLIEEGDRIMVAVSGGKDSYTLLDLLWRARARSPVKFDVVAVHLDQKQPGYDGRPLKTWLEGYGGPFEILERDTYSIVMGLTKPGDTFCAPCSRMRRGVLYTAAERLNCNKIALGHHRDDGLETLLMNLFYSGKLRAMPATYRTTDGRFEVIRPLMDCAEIDIAAYAQAADFPILPCNLCGSQSGLKRQAMTDLLDQIEETIPNVREVMSAALKNVSPRHLMDRRLAAAFTDAEDAEDAQLPALGGCGDTPPESPLITLI